MGYSVCICCLGKTCVGTIMYGHKRGGSLFTGRATYWSLYMWYTVYQYTIYCILSCRLNILEQKMVWFAFVLYTTSSMSLKGVEEAKGLNTWKHRVIILNRGSVFAFQWREFSPLLCSSHRLLQCYHRQKRDRKRCNSRVILPQPPPLGPLANERAVSSDVTLWRCTFWLGKFASVSSYSIVKACSL